MSSVQDQPLRLGDFSFTSRLFTGTGKFASVDETREALQVSGKTLLNKMREYGLVEKTEA